MTMATQCGWKIQGTPVLLYHGIDASPGQRRGKYWIPETSFQAHLQAVLAQGRKIVSLQNYWHKNQPDDSVVFTFDDGLSSDYETAFLHIQAAGATADFFINNSRVGKPGFATWAQVREMKDAGMSIQSHGPTHTPLTLLAPADLRETLHRGKQEIEDKIGAPVEFLSAPFGFLSRRVHETAWEAGFRAICDSESWPASMGAKVIHRITIDRNTSDQEFKAMVGGALFPFAKRALRRAVLHIPKRVLLRWAPQRLARDLEMVP